MPTQVLTPSIAPRQIALCTQMPVVNGTTYSDSFELNLHHLHKATAPIVLKVSGQFVRPGNAQSGVSLLIVQGSLDNVTWVKIYASDLYIPSVGVPWETLQPHSATVSGVITLGVVLQLYPYMRIAFADTGIMTGAFVTATILDR